MKKFVLIDHSLRSLGGHHYPYAYSVLTAAQRAGWQPVLAANRRFEARAELPREWRVHTLHAHESYSRYTLDTQARPAHAERVPLRGGLAPWRALRAWWTRRARLRLSAAFARDCALLFQAEPLRPGDVVFCATLSELDFAGLADYLAGAADVAQCAWHAQFHFGIFEGREPDYGAQAPAAAAMRAALEGPLRRCAPHPPALYCTTEQLTAQYESLAVARFGTLPYPVHELFRPRALPAVTAPLRIACLGHNRREKGYGQLPPILRELWARWFGAGRAQLVLQTQRGRQRQALESLVAGLAAPGAEAPAALDFADFPLPLERYAELLRGADVGLLLYDARRYYARCSGVLLEMLCAGVPVLTPAGGWLAAQIEPANQAWLAGIAAGAPPPQPLAADGAVTMPGAARSLLLWCRWRSAPPPGEYLRIELHAESAAGASRRCSVAIVGPGAAGLPVYCLMRLPEETRRVRIVARNAWRDAPAPIESLAWSTLADAPPLGALGLTIAESAEVPRLLDEVLGHIDHYRGAARAQAATRGAAHSGTQVLAGLGLRIAAPDSST